MTLATFTLAVLLAVILSALGTAKILALQPMRALAAEAGFSVAAYRRIGMLEVAAVIGLLIGLFQPLIGILTGAGLLLLLGGALVVHLRKGDGPSRYAPAVVRGALVGTYLALQLLATR